MLILKEPKTESSNRIVYISKQLVKELYERKEHIDKLKIVYFDEFTDYNLVFCQENGYPVGPRRCEIWFKKWQQRSKLGFPQLKFHEIRHSSSTYKLSRAGQDIKTVQGDTGHSDAKTLLDTYGHIQDVRRKKFSNDLADEFYGQTDIVNDDQNSVNESMDSLLSRVKGNPKLQKKLLAALLA